MLARFALVAPARRPGASAAWCVEHGGEHPGTLDLKAGGLVPILDLARWGAMAAGVTSATTPERLRAAAEAGTLAPADAHTLQDAFELINNLRLEHQVAQMRAGRQPDDYVDPEELSSLMRIQLRQAFRAVATIQKRVAAELDAGAATAGVAAERLVQIERLARLPSGDLAGACSGIASCSCCQPVLHRRGRSLGAAIGIGLRIERDAGAGIARGAAPTAPPPLSRPRPPIAVSGCPRRRQARRAMP